MGSKSPKSLEATIVFDGEAIVNGINELGRSMLLRGQEIIRRDACVAFCEDVPTEILEEMRSQNIGLATLIALLADLETIHVEGYTVCPTCSTISPDHGADCLHGRMLDFLRPKLREYRQKLVRG